MAIDGNISIYRATSEGETETSIIDKIEFDTSATNGPALLPDARSHINFVKIVMEKIHTEQPIPGTNNPINFQDTGLGIVTVSLTGFFDEQTGTALAISELATWMAEANQNTALFKGRFGLRMDERDEFNASPDGTPASTARGYNLITFELGEIDTEFPAIIPFVIVLQYNGDITQLG